MSLRNIQDIYDANNFDTNEAIDDIINNHKQLLDNLTFQNQFLQFRQNNLITRNENLDNITYKNKTLNEIYEIYKQKHKIKYPPIKRKNPIFQVININYDNPTPFKSKIKYVNKELKPQIKAMPPDYKLEPLKKFQRPYFSPKLGSWEIDICYAPDPQFKNQATYYLFCININSKFLEIFKLDNMTIKSIKRALQSLINNQFVSNIRGDGQFANLSIPNIKIYSNSEPFTQHNRVVDRVIRTIRDAIGSNYYDFANFNNITNIKNIYNNTPHNSLIFDKTNPTGVALPRTAIFTPNQVESNKDLEGIFIRENKNKLDDIKQLQDSNGLFDFKSGNILLVHLDYSKTPMRFNKIRRKFNALAYFLEYTNGNVKCRLLKPFELTESITKEDKNDKSIDFDAKDRIITVPIYYCKKVGNSIIDLPQNYKTYFL
jgi:hypothetical protein